MKIYSKFNDYYDTAIGYGIDPNVVYTRKTSFYGWDSKVGKILEKYIGNWDKLSWPERIDSPFRRWTDNGSISVTNTIVIIFCGYCYVGLELYKSNLLGDSTYEICYNTEQIEKFFNKHNVILPKKTPKKLKKWHDSKLNIRDFNLFWEKYPVEQSDKFIDLHFELDTPVLAIGDNKIPNTDGVIVLNPCLKDISFFKCLDAFTTFQELSMFIGGVMGGKVPAMIDIKDEDRIAMHGFDKWSFRRLPEKK